MEYDKCRLKGILAGMVLGDGCVGKTKNTCYFRLQHSEKQKTYMMYKVKLLELLTSVKLREIPPRGKRHPNVEITATTRTHPLYNRLRTLFYVNEKRTITPAFLDWLTPEGIALWYMDDGTLSKGYQCVISVAAFTLEEVTLIVNWFYRRYDIAFDIYVGSHGKYRPYYNISTKGTNTNKFLKLIEPYVVPDMQYKFRMRGPTGMSQSELYGNIESQAEMT